MADFSALDLAIHAARAMDMKGAEDLQILAVPPASGAPFDYVVLGNGRSERQVSTLAEEVFHLCKRHDIPHRPVEGEGGWRVIDCMDVIAHAFTAELRAFYRLETLWEGAQAIDLAEAFARVPGLEPHSNAKETSW